MSPPDPRAPNAVYIGLPRAGSTWLFENLRVHPEVFAPPAKGLWYFDRHHERGLEWYLRHFEGGRDHRIRIEFSHDYIHHAAASRRVAAELAAPTVLVTLREPVSFLRSTLRNFRRNGTSSRHLAELMSGGSLAAIGLHSRFLAPWIDEHGDRVHVTLFDDITDDPAAALAAVQRRLGVDVQIPATVDAVVNQAQAPRWRPAAAAAKRGALVASSLRMESLVARVKASPVVARALYRADLSTGPSEHVDSFHEEDLRRFFRPDVHELSRLIGQDVVARWGYD